MIENGTSLAEHRLSRFAAHNGPSATAGKRDHRLHRTIGGVGKERRRVIPAIVKMEVWKRDGGKCVICCATDELHFDHDLPYSLGGTSPPPENVQLLCARHNLATGAKLL
jgi:5-methylcytosine-specific restriction endonuclease McrA